MPIRKTAKYKETLSRYADYSSAQLINKQFAKENYRQMRKDYAYLVKKAEKARTEVLASKYGQIISDEIKQRPFLPARNLPRNPAKIAAHYAELRKYLRSGGSDMKKLKQREADQIEIFHGKGWKFVNESNYTTFINFLSSMGYKGLQFIYEGGNPMHKRSRPGTKGGYARRASESQELFTQRVFEEWSKSH